MYDCIIIGAGLIGMFTARELSLAGQNVLLLDRQRSGQESSWAGGGILSPLYPWRYPEPVTRLVAWSQAHYPELISQIINDTGLDPEWQRNGLLVVGSNEQLQAEQWAQQFGVEMLSLNNTELKNYEPVLSSRYENALWLPDIAQVRNPRLIKALKKNLNSLGVTIKEKVDVDELILSQGRVSGIVSKQGSWQAPQVVIASGAWSSRLFKQISTELPVEPVRGQMMIFSAKPNLLKRIVLGQEHYLIPRRDGRILIGSTLEYVGFNKLTTKQAYEHLQQAAFNLVPSLEQYPVEFHWAGLRPGTSNEGIPFIGEIDGIHGLYINTGHFRNGVVLAPASARLLADVMLKREPIVNPSYFQITSPT